MVQKLHTRFDFAKLAGVSPTAITKACKHALAPACVGKRIDAAHAAAIKYIEKIAVDRTPVLPGDKDPAYNAVAEWCRSSGKYNARAIEAAGIAPRRRAGRILDAMNGAGLIPAGVNSIKPAKGTAPTNPERGAPLSGHRAARERKKREAGAPLPAGIDRPEGPLDIPDDIRDFLGMTLRELVALFGTDVRFCDWLKATKDIEHINEKRLKNAKTQGELVARDLVKIGIIDPIEGAHVRLLSNGTKTIALRLSAMVKAGRDLPELEEFVVDQIASFIRPVKDQVRRLLSSG